jgi:deoxyribodipyrimidine photo-lyase
MSKTNIWWIRRDIRLHDNQTLNAAIREADHFVPLFIIEPELMSEAAPKRRSFMLAALSDLDQKLRELGSQLIVREGPAKKAFETLIPELDDVRIFAHEDFSPYTRARDNAIKENYNLNLTPGILLRHPSTILKDDGEPC